MNIQNKQTDNLKNGIRYHSSTKLENLADKYIETSLSQPRRMQDILKPHFVIVPNKNIRKWLYLEIAKKVGIATNFEFHNFETGLFKILSDFFPKDQYEYLDNRHYKLFVISGLRALLQNPKSQIKNLRNYLYMENAERPDFSERIYQLASKLSLYFREYELHYKLAETLYSSNSTTTLDETSKVYKEEISLYNQIFQKGKLRDKYNKNLLTLPQLVNEIFSKNNLENNPNCNEIVIFALPQVSEFHYELIYKLSKYYLIHIYQINPIVSSSIAQTENNSSKESLLDLWGKPYFDGLKILQKYPEYYINEQTHKKINKPESNLLNHLQYSILTNTTNPTKFLKQDKSLQILSCPGIYREVETIFQSIITNMKEDQELKLTDIAILTTDIKKYHPIINSIFHKKEAEQNGITFNLSDSNARKDSIYGAAVLSLLNLSKGDFTRKEVFELLQNPYFIEGVGVDRSDVENWLNFVDDLNVFHSFDYQDRMAKNYPKGDVYSWNQAFLRLRFGKLIDTQLIAKEHYFPEFNGILPYNNVDGQNDKLFVLIEDLFRRMEKIKKESTKWNAKIWKSEIESLLNTYLKVPNEQKSEVNVQEALFDSLNYLEILNQKGDLNLSLVIQFIQDFLESIPTSTGNYLTGGVTIASFLPLRPIPFKIIYILGLDEGSFPGMEDSSLLNVKPMQRMLGDFNVKERNLYLFLETLLCAEKKLYLTYNAWDIQKDEEKYPSSVINQLVSYLEEYILAPLEDGTKSKFKFVKIPLVSYDSEFFEPKDDITYTDVFRNNSYKDRLLNVLNGSKDLDWQKLDEEYKLGIFKSQFSRMHKKINEIENPEEKIILNLYDLRKFLENPIESQLNKYFGISREQEEDKSLEEAETFYSDSLSQYKMMTHCIHFYIQNFKQFNKDDFDIYLDSYYKSLTLKSETPEFAFAELDKRKFKEEIMQRIFSEKGIYHCISQLENDSTFYPNICLGSPKHTMKHFHKFDPIQLTDWNLEIVGSVSNFYVNKDRVSVFIITNRSRWSNPLLKFVFEPYLFCLLSLCGFSEELRGLFGRTNVHLVVSHKAGIKELEYNITTKEAREYIDDLLTDFVKKDSFETIPFSIISDNSKLNLNSKNILDEPEYSKFLKETLQNSLEDPYSFGAFPEYLKLLKLHVPMNTKAKVMRRFGKLLLT